MMLTLTLLSMKSVFVNIHTVQRKGSLVLHILGNIDDEI